MASTRTGARTCSQCNQKFYSERELAEHKKEEHNGNGENEGSLRLLFGVAGAGTSTGAIIGTVVGGPVGSAIGAGAGWMVGAFCGVIAAGINDIVGN